MAFASRVEGIVWPAVPTPFTLGCVPVVLQLEESQWWLPEKLREMQFVQLRQLLSHAVRSVPFYRERLGGAGYEPDSPLDEDFWRSLPLLRRSDIQEAGEALRSEALPESHGTTTETYSSGTTGAPVHAIRSQVHSVISEAATLRHEIWHKRDFSGKLASIRSSKEGYAPYPEGAPGAWPEMVGALFVTGPVVCMNVNCSVAEHVEWLQRENPEYLHTFPSVAERAASYCLENDIRLPGLRDIETIAERITPRTRELCREAFDVPVIGLYSSREIGHISHQCPDHEHDHVQSEMTFVEVLKDDGTPCEPGEIGRVVVTQMHNFAMPFIRYEIGDYAEVGPPCACGRGLPVLKQIMGRIQDKIRLPNGEERWSLLSANVLKALLACGPVREYQLVQKALDAMELRVTAERDLSAEEEEKLADWVRNTFGYPFQVTVLRQAEIPRTAGGKHRDFISELSG